MVQMYFYHPKCTFSPISPLLKQGPTALSLFPILVYRIVMFPSVSHSSLMSLSPTKVLTFAEVKPSSQVDLNLTFAGVLINSGSEIL